MATRKTSTTEPEVAAAEAAGVEPETVELVGVDLAAGAEVDTPAPETPAEDVAAMITAPGESQPEATPTDPVGTTVPVPSETPADTAAVSPLAPERRIATAIDAIQHNGQDVRSGDPITITEPEFLALRRGGVLAEDDWGDLAPL